MHGASIATTIPGHKRVLFCFSRPPTFEQQLDRRFNKILDFILAKGDPEYQSFVHLFASA
jgi:hypothetical protein